MKILAVESSCDETAVAVVEDGRTVLTDCIASQVALHRLYGGVVPELASRKHIEAIYALADEALFRASITRQEIDAIAVTYATGLIGAVALMRPSKSVQDLELKSVKKKFKSANFAAGCSREVITRGAEMLGWTLDDLITRTIAAMRATPAAD